MLRQVCRHGSRWRLDMHTLLNRMLTMAGLAMAPLLQSELNHALTRLWVNGVTIPGPPSGLLQSWLLV